MKIDFDWRDYDDYAKWLHDVLTTLYEENEELRAEKVNLLSENQQLKKQKDDVVEYINNNSLYEEEYDYDYEENSYLSRISDEQARTDLLRMLGEIE